MKERLLEIEQRKAEIGKELKSDKKVDLVAIEEELRELKVEQAEIEKRQSILSDVEAIEKGQNITKTEEKEERKMENTQLVEQRAKALKEDRMVTTDQTALVGHAGADVDNGFNSVSTLVEGVKVIPLIGGETFKAPYRVTASEGGITKEGVAYKKGEQVFDYALMAKVKVTDYAEVTEEVEKLPAGNFTSLVEDGVLQGLRRKINEQILLGQGGAEGLTGIFTEEAKAIEASTDLEIEEITANTLNDIVFSYGGEEDVEGDATLIMNKQTLREFANLRTELGTPVHEVVVSGNTATIDGVPVVVNSFAPALNKAEAGEYVIAYGSLQNYSLAVFSDVDMQRSTDFKFNQGIVAYKGNIMLAGNVSAHNGFLRVKKK